MGIEAVHPLTEAACPNGGTRYRRNDGMEGGEAVMAKDPVCGMEINPEQAAARSDYQGQTYYFCSADCKQTFDATPQQYAAPAR